MMTPGLSIVVTTRNDDRDGSGLTPLRRFVFLLAEQAAQEGLAAEVIIVEWNPPADRPRLAEAIPWPDHAGTFAVRIITVPPEIHHGFGNAEKLPLFQFIAKNAGIRRARGAFILATNVDVFFSSEMVRFLASQRLRRGAMYRVDRHDVRPGAPEGLSADAFLLYCRQNVTRINEAAATREVCPGSVGPSNGRHRGWKQVLHTNACGDFTLMAREHWFAVRGYPEFPLRAMKLDGLLCGAAHFAGARQVVLRDPIRIYHVDHPARGDGAAAALSERSAPGTNGLQISGEQYAKWMSLMRQERRPIIFNPGESWGLANESLKETEA